MATFAKIAEGLVYGWTINYFLEIEGVPVLLKEQDFGATDPSGYGTDASLVIDDSASIGSIVDRKKGIGRGFDLSIRLLDTATVRSMFTAPAQTELTADFASTVGGGDSVSVASTTAFAASGIFYIGTEAVPYSSKTATTFVVSATRGIYGRKRDHPAESLLATVVTTGPRWWRGRGVKLWAAAVDPMGNVPGDDLRDEASCIWKGTLETSPLRVDGLWAMEARSIDRKLDRDLTAPVSGTGVWDFDDDPLMTVDPLLSYNVRIWEAEWDPSGQAYASTQTDYTIQPFAAKSAGDQLRFSTQRDLMRDAWATATSGTASDWVWSKHLALDAASPAIFYRASVRRSFTPTAAATPIVSAVSSLVAGEFKGGDVTGEGNLSAPPKDDGNGDYIVQTGLEWWIMVDQAALSVRVDSGDPADIPLTGYVILETDGFREWFRYTSATADPANPQNILVEFDGTAQDITGMVYDQLQGKATEVSVSFAFRDTGLAKDTMRKMLMSSGRGDNGADLTADTTALTADATTGTADTTGTDSTWDSLPVQQGYDIEGVDAESFDNVMDGAFQFLSLDLLLDSGASFTKIYGGMLSLSQRAVVPVSVGTDVKLRAVHTGLSVSGANSVTVTDSDLVTSGNGSSIRPKHAINNPNKVTAKLAALTDETAGEIVANDVYAMRAHGTTQWGVTLYGASRASWSPLVFNWTDSLFSTSQLAQVVEMDVRPSLDIKVGDLIRIDSSHWNLWQYSAGAPGYTGWARVLGRQIGLASGVQTLTVIVDGVNFGLALSPSAPITAWTGSASAATTVTIPVAYAAVMQQYLDGLNPFRLMAYIPGAEAAADDGYDISAIETVGPDLVLTVDAQNGAFTITSDWFLTLPSVPNSSTEELYYIHTNENGVWV